MGMICGISRRNAPFLSVSVAPWLCGSCSCPSVVCAQIWMRCPASGAPPPARRTVPLIRKPPLPIRSTIAEPLRTGGQQEPGNPGCQDGAASGEEVAAVEYDGGHVNSSCDRAVAPPRGRQQARDATNLTRLRPIFQLQEAKLDRSQ